MDNKDSVTLKNEKILLPNLKIKKKQKIKEFQKKIK